MSNPTIVSKVTEAAKTIVCIPGLVKTLKETMPVSPNLGLKAMTEEGHDIIVQEYIWKRLEVLGIYKDEDSNAILMSADCTEGDARHVFCENGEPNLPVARFKRVWSILKAKAQDTAEKQPERPETASDAIQKMVETLKPIGQWTDAELLAKYGVEASSEIIDELDSRAKGRAFVVFSNEPENIIDVETTLRMLKEARKRETPVCYKAADTLKRLYKAGDFPSQIYSECPLHPGVLLVDGYCDKCSQSWEGVGELQRQFVRIIQQMGEAPKDSPGMRQLIMTAMKPGTSELAADYPKVFVRFNDLAAEDKLPSLKSRTAVMDGVGRSDPFAPGKRF